MYIVYGAGLADMLTKRMKVRGQRPDDARIGRQHEAHPRKTIAVRYSNYMHIVVKASAGINTIPDLKGKRVSIGAAGSGTETKGIPIARPRSRASPTGANGSS